MNVSAAAAVLECQLALVVGSTAAHAALEKHQASIAPKLAYALGEVGSYGTSEVTFTVTPHHPHTTNIPSYPSFLRSMQSVAFLTLCWRCRPVPNWIHIARGSFLVPMHSTDGAPHSIKPCWTGTRRRWRHLSWLAQSWMTLWIRCVRL